MIIDLLIKTTHSSLVSSKLPTTLISLQKHYLIPLLFLLLFNFTYVSTTTSCRSIPPHQYPNYPIHPDCGLGEYCSDSLKECVLLSEHPKWGANCSRNILLSKWVCVDNSAQDQDVTESDESVDTSLWLEGDLECIHHKCFQCEEGSRNFSNGMICLGHVWKFERSSSFFENYSDLVFKRDVTSIVLIVSMVLFFVSTIIGLFIDGYKIKMSKTEISVLEEEMIKDSHFMKFYEKKIAKERSKRLKRLQQKRKAMEGAPFFSSDEDSNKVEETNDINQEEMVRNEHFSESDGEGLNSNIKSTNRKGKDISEEGKIERISRPLPLNPMQRKHLDFLQKLQEEEKETNKMNVENNSLSSKKGEKSTSNFTLNRNGNSNIHRAMDTNDGEY